MNLEPIMEIRRTEGVVSPEIIYAHSEYTFKNLPIKDVDSWKESGVEQVQYYTNRGIMMARLLYSSCPASYVEALKDELITLYRNDAD
jgi:hypothetical protein